MNFQLKARKFVKEQVDNEQLLKSKVEFLTAKIKLTSIHSSALCRARRQFGGL